MAEEWAERRRRSSEGIAEAIRDGAQVPPGVAELHDSFERRF